MRSCLVVDRRRSQGSGRLLEPTSLISAKLSKAALYRADLSSARLKGAKLTLANPIQANLSMADCFEVDLSGHGSTWIHRRDLCCKLVGLSVVFGEMGVVDRPVCPAFH